VRSNRLIIVAACISLAAIVSLIYYYKAVTSSDGAYDYRPGQESGSDPFEDQAFSLKRYDVGSWRKRRAQIASELRESIGVEKLEGLRGELRAEVVSTSDKALYRIENVVIEPIKGWYISGSLFIPKHFDMPRPAVLNLPGHFDEGSRFFFENKKLSHTLAGLGFVVFAIDMYGFPERTGEGIEHYVWPTQRRLRKLGMSSLAIPVFEAESALDYLLTRREVNPKSIGVMGFSGGATSAIVTALLDRRARAVAAVGYTHSFVEGCPCGLLPPEWRSDPQLILEVYAAVAPKPALFIAERPTDMRFVHYIYTILDVPKMVTDVELYSTSGHCEIGPQGRGIITAFFADSLGYPCELPSDDELACFPDGMPQDRMSIDDLVSLIENGVE